MDIRSSLEGLKSVLGTPHATPAVSQARDGAPAAGEKALASDQATLSNAGSAVSESALNAGVRAEKVASIQAALISGSYSVPASAVASKVVDSMLGGGR